MSQPKTVTIDEAEYEEREKYLPTCNGCAFLPHEDSGKGFSCDAPASLACDSVSRPDRRNVIFVLKENG